VDTLRVGRATTSASYPLKVDRNYLFSILELSRVDRLPPPEKATEHRISAPLTQQVAAQAAVEEAMVRRTLSGLVLA